MAARPHRRHHSVPDGAGAGREGHDAVDPRQARARPWGPCRHRRVCYSTRMTSQYWPFFDLRRRTGRLELRPPTDDELEGLARLAAAGIHDPAVMPFAVPWTDAPPGELERSLLQYHWTQRDALRPDDWNLELGVWADGQLAGSQSIRAHAPSRSRDAASAARCARRSWSWRSWASAPRWRFRERSPTTSRPAGCREPSGTGSTASARRRREASRRSTTTSGSTARPGCPARTAPRSPGKGLRAACRSWVPLGADLARRPGQRSPTEYDEPILKLRGNAPESLKEVG